MKPAHSSKLYFLIFIFSVMSLWFGGCKVTDLEFRTHEAVIGNGLTDVTKVPPVVPIPL